LLDTYAAVVCDLDGVVYRGPAAVAHAVEVLSTLSVPVVYATNNASRTPRRVAEHLVELGLRVAADDVVTSSQAGAAALAQRLPAGADVLAVGGEGVREALLERGLHSITPREARAADGVAVAGVLQGYGAEVSAADLAEAAYAVQGGAVWVATNMDGTLPTHRGISPGNGTLVAAVQRATGLAPLVVGKPHAPLYLLCAERLGQSPRRILAVGDRLDTDIAGAVEARMDSVLVLTGVDSVTSLATAPPHQRPTYVVEDLRALTTPYTSAETDFEWWVCGEDRRRIVEGEWVVQHSGGPIEAARAGVAAIHEALDLGDIDTQTAHRLVSDLDVWQ
jgi:HAD superfamily hydrolase (TIGR01450 family)